jgi:hypothetical protein
LRDESRRHFVVVRQKGFNPLKHIDPLGTILLPGILLLMRSPFLFGYFDSGSVQSQRNGRVRQRWVSQRITFVSGLRSARKLTGTGLAPSKLRSAIFGCKISREADVMSCKISKPFHALARLLRRSENIRDAWSDFQGSGACV